MVSQPESEQWWRPIVSRATMAVLGMALLWGAWKCFNTAAYLRDDYRKRVAQGELPRTRRNASGAHLPMLMGAALSFGGGALVLLSVTPLGFIHKIGIGGTTLHDRPDVHPGGVRRF